MILVARSVEPMKLTTQSNQHTPALLVLPYSDCCWMESLCSSNDRSRPADLTSWDYHIHWISQTISTGDECRIFTITILLILLINDN